MIVDQGIGLVPATPMQAIGTKAYVDWLRRSALPFWGTAGFDQQTGRFHERLDFSGKPVAVPQRAMVQARQIFVFAAAVRLGWDEKGYSKAVAALGSLRKDFCIEEHDSASFVFSTDGHGRVISADRDSYTHAFVLLSLASLYALDGNRAHLQLADKVLAFVDRELTDPINRGLLDQAGASPNAPKRQNPQMHMFEACIFLAEAAPDRGYEERANDIGRLFEERILAPSGEYFAEIFSGDWSASLDQLQARTFEPGHLLEWAWLIKRAQSIGCEDRTHLLQTMIDRAFATLDQRLGLLPDKVDAESGVAVPYFRLWPHAEALKAANLATANLATASLATKAKTLRSANAIADLILQHFLGAPFEGGWIDRRDAEGRPLVDHVPASSLYHLMLAASEVASVIVGEID